MAQTLAQLGAYNPIFYAQETLIHLRKALGMASRIHRGYELERRSVNKGDTIAIRRPATFVAAAAPSSAQALDTGTVNIVVDQNPEVKFEISDVQYAFTGEDIIRDHIEPAAYALALDMDTKCCALAKDVPWVSDYGAVTDHTIITAARKIMVDNNVPMDEGRLHFMVDSSLEAFFINASIALIGTAPTATEAALLRGSIGYRAGVEIFMNQNVASHTPGTLAQAAGDGLGAVNGAHAKGATSLVVASFTGSETVKKGDIFGIAGNTQQYAVAADATMSTGAATLTITPPLVAALAGSEVITFYPGSASQSAPNDGAQSMNLMFHRNAFALAMAPLPDNLPGIEVFTATDPVTGMSVRARRWADGSNSKLIMALDVLYGVKTLDGNLAVRSST